MLTLPEFRPGQLTQGEYLERRKRTTTLQLQWWVSSGLVGNGSSLVCIQYLLFVGVFYLFCVRLCLQVVRRPRISSAAGEESSGGGRRLEETAATERADGLDVLGDSCTGSGGGGVLDDGASEDGPGGIFFCGD